MSPAAPIPFSRYSGFGPTRDLADRSDRGGADELPGHRQAAASKAQRHRALHRALSPTFPAGAMVFFIPSRGGAEDSGAAQRIKGNKAIADQPPLLNLSTKSHDSNERLRVSNWIVQRLNYYAVKKTIEFRLLTVFQHVADPARVCTVADKNSAVTPLDLRPTVADQVFEGNGIEVRGQFDCAVNMPSTC